MKNHYEFCGSITKIFLNNRKLNRNIIATISTSDLEKVNRFKGTWYAKYDKNTNNYYVLGHMIGNNAQLIRLHRFILDAPDNLIVDHKDNNPLNNTRSNLRLCSNDENIRNREKKAACKSKYKGVTYDSSKAGKRWRARISYNGGRINLGYFLTEKEAAQAYNEASKIYHGRYSKLNKV